MKSIYLKKFILASSALLLFAGSALATTGTSTEGMRNKPLTQEQVLQKTKSEYSRTGWEGMSTNQKSMAIQKEEKRLTSEGFYFQQTKVSKPR